MPAIPRPDATKLADDGTRQLLQWGGSMVGIGLLCVVLLATVLGGFFIGLAVSLTIVEFRQRDDKDLVFIRPLNYHAVVRD